MLGKSLDLPPADYVWGELGITLLEQGRFTEALNAMLRGNHWQDAAYLAERVVSIEGFRGDVDKEWPEAKDLLATRIRYLLGRRLIRNGILHRTGEYLPEKLKSAFNDYATALETAKDTEKTSSVRAQAYMTAARIGRYQGLELMSTEWEPDWFVCDGQVEEDPITKSRVGFVSMETLFPGDDIDQVRDTPDLM